MTFKSFSTIETRLPVSFLFIFSKSSILFLTGAYFALHTPHFNITTPSLDFQMVKTLITASCAKELVSLQRLSDPLILEYFVDPLCFWTGASVISIPKLKASCIEPSTARGHSGPACRLLCRVSAIMTIIHCVSL